VTGIADKHSAPFAVRPLAKRLHPNLFVFGIHQKSAAVFMEVYFCAQPAQQVDSENAIQRSSTGASDSRQINGWQLQISKMVTPNRQVADCDLLRAGFYRSVPGCDWEPERSTVSKRLDVQKRSCRSVYEKEKFDSRNANFNYGQYVAGLKADLFGVN
jgi:hypothetical protein